ncbi:MAG: SulP family inorganic anion transporter [Bacteroidota bacterium]
MVRLKIKYDLPAGLVVFLVALPLCLGIALASGAPLLSGIISGIIGGIVVGTLSGSSTSVSGPAAGLAAVVLAAITKLGGFEVFSAALFIAGFLQLLCGLLKGGFIANYIPSNVIKGLLAAIGIVLILKQVPQALGYDNTHQDDFSFVQTNGENTFSHLFNTFFHITPGVFLISLISVLVLVFWDKTPMKRIRFLPASLFVVILGIGLNWLFGLAFPALYLRQGHLVNLPATNVADLKTFFKIPPLTMFGNYQVWLTAFTLAIVASLETLLNLEAVDNIDPHKRESPPNRELYAQGIGNMVAGLVGGLPVTSVIVRSSVNINAGAQSKFSAITHGVLLLVAILVLSPFINLIPFASLAAILIFTGYKLAKISVFKSMFAKGWNQFIPFIVTIVAIILTDLLIGIVIGLAVSLFYLLKSNYQNPFTIEKGLAYSTGEIMRMELPSQVSFLNKASIKSTLWSVPHNGSVVIDASYADFIDNDVLELITDFKNVIAPERNIKLNLLGVKEVYQLLDHIQFVNVLDRQAQEKLQPYDILKLLTEGNDRFMLGQGSEKYYRHQVNATSSGQFPMAVVVSCIDSRIASELIFDANLGDIISIRIAGNIVSTEILGSIELSVKEIGAKLIVVMGHSNCGAVGAAIHALTGGNIDSVTKKIQPAIDRTRMTGVPKDMFAQHVTYLNTQNSVDEILANSTYLNEKVIKGECAIVPAFYNTATGEVLFGEQGITVKASQTPIKN